MDSFTHRRQPSGFAAIYTVIILIALCGIVSLGVDLGRVQLAKAELQTAADAAARAAAVGISTSANQAIADAVAVAAANKCDGSAVVLNASADVELGTWDSGTKTFTALSGAAANSATAVRVTTRRLASRGTAIPLVFAKVVGRQSCDVKAVAIASASRGSGTTTGFVGLNEVELGNNAVAASYRSSNGHPGSGNIFSNGSVGSNGEVELDNNAKIKGQALLGPSGKVKLGNGASISGGQVKLSSALSYAPTDPGNAATVNDNAKIGKTSKGKSPLSGKAFALDNSETISIGAGTYYFTSVTLSNNAKITFTGAVTVYVAGDVDLGNGAEIVASGNRPANLKLRVVGSETVELSNNARITADIYAPGSGLELGNNGRIAGAGIFKEIEADNNSELYYDESLGRGGGSGSGVTTISLVR